MSSHETPGMVRPPLRCIALATAAWLFIGALYYAMLALSWGFTAFAAAVWLPACFALALGCRNWLRRIGSRRASLPLELAYAGAGAALASLVLLALGATTLPSAGHLTDLGQPVGAVLALAPLVISLLGAVATLVASTRTA